MVSLTPLSAWTVVFDLDDTLYLERDYQTSGFRCIVEHLTQLFPDRSSDTLLAQLNDPAPDPLGRLCRSLDLPDSVQQSLLWLYRLHPPQIQLRSDAPAVLTELRRASAGLAVLTDGRAITQRLKLRALGLSHLPAYISEEYNSAKPDPLRFRMIESEFRSTHYCYVGDNPAKDFLGPRQLGWLTVGLRDFEGLHVHPQTCSDPEAQPHHWLHSLRDLIPLLARPSFFSCH